MNTRRGGMKRLMEEVAARHVKAIHYSMLAYIQIRGEDTKTGKDDGFWPVVREGLPGKKLMKEEVDRVEEPTSL